MRVGYRDVVAENHYDTLVSAGTVATMPVKIRDIANAETLTWGTPEGCKK